MQCRKRTVTRFSFDIVGKINLSSKSEENVWIPSGKCAKTFRVNNKTGSERAIDFWKDFSSRLKSAEDAALNYDGDISPRSQIRRTLQFNELKLSKCST